MREFKKLWILLSVFIVLVGCSATKKATDDNPEKEEENIQNEETPKKEFALVSYDVKSGNMVMDQSNSLSFANGTIQLYIEVSGEIGESFVVVIENNAFIELTTEIKTQSVEQEQFEIVFEIDSSTSYFEFALYPKDQYDANKKTAESFGSIFIFNKQQ